MAYPNRIILRTLRKKYQPGISSKIGATLKRKNLLPEGTDSEQKFLLRAVPVLKEKIFYDR